MSGALNVTRDPKGYYIALGLADDADGEAVKMAYRTKAKRLHPDFNPSPVAAKQFHRLHEAYSTLSDPAKRAAYDKPWRDLGAKTKASASASRAGDSDAEMRAEKNEDKTPRAEKPQPGESVWQSVVEQPVVCKCGKVTAQPRYIVFDLVWGRLTSVQRKGIAGVFCRTCADRTAVRASLLTWVAGWWAWPDGPRATVRALLNNIRGGRKPADRNARLLMRQARAFRGRGEMELARNAAEQALSFATTASLRREVDHLLGSLSSYPARPLKNRWAEPGWAPMVQVMPLALMVAALSMSVTMSGFSPIHAAKTGYASVVQFVERSLPRFGSANTDPAPPSTDVRANPVGRVYSIAVDSTAVRTGPGGTYQVVAVLSKGTVVLVTETDPSGMWFRVVTAEGASGFVTQPALSPDVRMDALKDLGSFPRP
ncbi:MAG: DnaJ domain-containing protein [Rhodospirillaceae bacterium]